MILVFGARNNPDEAATNYVGRQIQVHYLIYSNQFFEYERMCFQFEYRNMLGHNLERLLLHDLNKLEKDLELGISRVNAMKVSYSLHNYCIYNNIRLIKTIQNNFL